MSKNKWPDQEEIRGTPPSGKRAHTLWIAAAIGFEQRAAELHHQEASIYVSVDVKSIEIDQPRTLGPEYLVNSIWNELELDHFFKKQGVKANTIKIIHALVTGRLANPGSERETKNWADNISGIYELIGTPDYSPLILTIGATDVLYSLQDELEKHLSILA